MNPGLIRPTLVGLAVVAVLASATLVASTTRAQQGGASPGQTPWHAAAEQAAAQQSLAPVQAAAEARDPEDQPARTTTTSTSSGVPGTEVPEITPGQVPRGDLWSTAFPELPGDGWTVIGMGGVLAAALLLMMIVSRLRVGLPVQGLIPTTLATAHVLLQLFALLTGAGIIARLLPAALAPAVPWAIVAVAIAVGWSSRDVLPDLVAAAVITFEQRIRPGIWMSTGDLSGLVERRGLRAVWLRDGHGNRIAIPNRKLLVNHVAVQEAAGPVHEVALRVSDRGPTKEVRRALLEATLTSPWARPDAAPVVRQDGGDPELWHIRAHLLEMRFAGRFEGDLLERTEEVLAVARMNQSAATAKSNEPSSGAGAPEGTKVSGASGNSGTQESE